MSNLALATQLLHERFKFPAFRAGQEAVISRLLDGRSTLAIFPTGAGKSLCYQLPSLCLKGLTLVVSPLIALMKDQLDALERLDIAAARYDSTLSREEAAVVREKLAHGRLKLLYIAPERLADEKFRRTLERADLALLAIDEAHCISEWGHNFRPDYLRLAQFAAQLKIPRVLALTATATPLVAQQIAENLSIAPADIVRTSFHRPNLELRVTVAGGEARDRTLIEALSARPRGPAIVYVTLQRTAERVAALLSEEGVTAWAYHAGLADEERHHMQDTFMSSPNAIIVATIAFGMGIDKSDIRYVYHYNLPKSLENYAQEIGRAGRDEQPSVCELLLDPDDCTILENFTYGDTPEPEEIASVLREVLGAEPVFDLSVYDLSLRHDLRPLVVETLLAYLELEGVIEPIGHFYADYQLALRIPPDEIAAQFDPRRQEFLSRFFAAGKVGRKWLTLNRQQTARTLEIAPEVVSRTVEYLEERGFLESKPSGVRRSFRRRSDGGERQQLLEMLTARFLTHEARQIERVQEILRYASSACCRTGYLLKYFGEEGLARCGHCDLCQGSDAPRVVRVSPGLKGADRQVMADARIRLSLTNPRRLARFLCGLSTPSFTRGGFTRDPAFGSLAAIPFGEVLAEAHRISRAGTAIEGECGENESKIEGRDGSLSDAP